jgi:hypothetical protein
MVSNKALVKRVKLLMENQALPGYHSPSSGRITYNKVVGTNSFSHLSSIIADIAPVDIMTDANQNGVIPSIAKTLDVPHGVRVYDKYLYVHSTMDAFMDYEDDEDSEKIEELLDYVSECGSKVPVVGVCVQTNEHAGSAHACAFIVWKVASKDAYKFAFYDPLDYKKGNKSFNFAETALQAHRFPQQIEFINLNKYCFHKSADEFHCSQYVINAEYCYIYSLYFLDQWIQGGAKLHRASFAKAIKRTYVVKPQNLTRVNNEDSMMYRIVMMGFICTTLLKYLRQLTRTNKKYIKYVEQNIKKISAFVKDFQTTYGFSLIDE